jgi:hypothetical protein
MSKLAFFVAAALACLTPAALDAAHWSTGEDTLAQLAIPAAARANERATQPPEIIAESTEPLPNGGGDADTAATGSDVPFRVCEMVSPWHKRTPQEMERVFSLKRWGDGERVFPSYWRMYLSHFYWIPMPSSASGQMEPTGFSDRPAGPQDTLCPGEFPRRSNFQALWLLDHSVKRMTHVGTTLTVEVEPLPDSFQSVRFSDVLPAKPLAVGKNEQALFTSIRIVHSGRTLFEWLPGGAIAEYDHAGKLIGAHIRSGMRDLPIRSLTPIDIEVARDWSSSSEGAIVVLNTIGQAIARHPIPAGGQSWDIVAVLHLPPGVSILHAEWPAGGDSGFAAFPVGGPKQ